MTHVFKIRDKFRREIHLSKERWKHIKIYHPKVETPEEVYDTIQKPDKTIFDKKRGC